MHLPIALTFPNFLLLNTQSHGGVGYSSEYKIVRHVR